MSKERGYRELEHTADLALELWGQTEALMLRAGADAVVEIITGGAQFEPRDERTVELRTVDDADRLVQWLNEVLYLALVEGFVVADAHLTLADGGLSAVLRGEEGAGARIETEIKSATYHDLRVVHGDGRVSAVVVLDV